MGLPAAIVLLVMIAEFFGSLGLITGFLGRVAAFGVFCVMLGAIFKVHLHNGFFMNWMGNQKGEGIEYFIPVIAIALVLMIKGGGRWALDSALAERISKGSKA